MINVFAERSSPKVEKKQEGRQKDDDIKLVSGVYERESQATEEN